MNTWESSCTFSVCAPSQLRVATVSYQTVLMASARARGMATWSQTPTKPYPLRSHACVTASSSAGPAVVSQSCRIIVDCACTGSCMPKLTPLVDFPAIAPPAGAPLGVPPRETTLSENSMSPAVQAGTSGAPWMARSEQMTQEGVDTDCRG